MISIVSSFCFYSSKQQAQREREWENLSNMVYYFTSNVVHPSAFIYVGKDKFESMNRSFLSSFDNRPMFWFFALFASHRWGFDRTWLGKRCLVAWWPLLTICDQPDWPLLFCYLSQGSLRKLFRRISSSGTHFRIVFSSTSITCLVPTFTYAFAMVKPGTRSPNSL